MGNGSILCTCVVHVRPHNNRRHGRPMGFCAPTNVLGALESSLLFCHSLTGNGLGTLSCLFKMALKMSVLQNPYFEAWYMCFMLHRVLTNNCDILAYCKNIHDVIESTVYFLINAWGVNIFKVGGGGTYWR